MTSWYHLMVSARPMRKGVVDLNPNSFWARSTFSLRLGCPSGFDASHSTLPW